MEFSGEEGRLLFVSNFHGPKLSVIAMCLNNFVPHCTFALFTTKSLFL